MFFSITANYLFSQTGWQWNNPLPQGNTLREVMFIDSVTVVAVGEGGTIVRSSDAGITWSLIQSSAVENLKDVSFANSSIGFAAGSNGVIIKTTNGGLTWFNLYSGTTKNLRGVSFSNSQTGTVVGENGTVLRTTDGGINWYIQNAYVTPHLNDVHFVNNVLGYAAGDSSLFMKTTNGGQTWLKSWFGYGIQTRLEKVTFFDADTGWVVVQIGFVSIVAKTTNGGYSWVETVGSSGIYYFLDVHFTDALHGIAVAAARDPRIYLTSDGGATWQLVNIGIAGFSPSGISDFSPYAVSSNQNGYISIVGKYGRIFLSSDRGNTWSNRSSRFRGRISGIHFFNDNAGIAIIDTNSIIQTTNSGISWDRKTITTSGYLLYGGMHFYDSLHGAISDYYGKNNFTNDGGLTWIQRQGYSAEKIFLLDSLRVITIYGNLFITKSSDQGINWSLERLGYSHSYLRGIHFYKSRIGYIVGDSGSVLRTNDKGENWSNQSIGIVTSLRDVFVLDSLTAYIVGYSGNIFKTTDAGFNWISLNSGVANNLLSVLFVNKDTGWVAGSGGIILHTSNGGANWIKQPSGTVNELRAISFPSALTGFIAGEGGTILKTIDGGLPVELSSFTASLRENNMVELRWTTMTETNNFGFEIERRTQETNWERIGSVHGRGTTTEIQNYSFIDALNTKVMIQNPKLFYRLKQIDTDGRFSYSPTVLVFIAPTERDAILFSNYPNPVAQGSEVTISFWTKEQGHARLDLFDVLGRKIETIYDETMYRGMKEINFIPRNLSAGIYFYKLLLDGKLVGVKSIAFTQ